MPRRPVVTIKEPFRAIATFGGAGVLAVIDLRPAAAYLIGAFVGSVSVNVRPVEKKEDLK